MFARRLIPCLLAAAFTTGAYSRPVITHGDMERISLDGFKVQMADGTVATGEISIFSLGQQFYFSRGVRTVANAFDTDHLLLNVNYTPAKGEDSYVIFGLADLQAKVFYTWQIEGMKNSEHPASGQLYMGDGTAYPVLMLDKTAPKTGGKDNIAYIPGICSFATENSGNYSADCRALDIFPYKDESNPETITIPFEVVPAGRSVSAGSLVNGVVTAIPQQPSNVWHSHNPLKQVVWQASVPYKQYNKPQARTFRHVTPELMFYGGTAPDLGTSFYPYHLYSSLPGMLGYFDANATLSQHPTIYSILVKGNYNSSMYWASDTSKSNKSLDPQQGCDYLTVDPSITPGEQPCIEGMPEPFTYDGIYDPSDAGGCYLHYTKNNLWHYNVCGYSSTNIMWPLSMGLGYKVTSIEVFYRNGLRIPDDPKTGFVDGDRPVLEFIDDNDVHYGVMRSDTWTIFRMKTNSGYF